MIGSSPVESQAILSTPRHARHHPRTRIHNGLGACRLCNVPRAALGTCDTGTGSTGFSSSRSFPMSSTHLAAALVAPFEQLRMTDVESVGGKNASLGEMISQLSASGVRVPGGFATISRPASSGSSASISCNSAVPPPNSSVNRCWKCLLTSSKEASSRSRASRLRFWMP